MARHARGHLLAACLLLVLAAPVLGRPAMTMPERQALLDLAQARGRLPVIVALAVPTVAAGEPTPAAIAAVALGLLRDLGVRPTAEGALGGPGITNVKPFATIPYLALTVDPAALERLLTHPAVRAVEADQAVAPN